MTDPAWHAAVKASDDALSARPTTAAGLAAMIDLFVEREMQADHDPIEQLLIALFDSVKAFVSGERT